MAAVSGKELRIEVPRGSHAEYEPVPERRDPVDILVEQSASRVPELVPIRYGRMAVSPFTFFRGAAAIMARDLALSTKSTGIKVQACGDAHLANFGMFSSPERRLVFDINDFDETLPAPWEWDIKRLAASFTVAGRNNGLKSSQRRAAVARMSAGYRTQMRQYAQMRNIDVFYARLEVDQWIEAMRQQVDTGLVKRAEKTRAKAMTKDNLSAFAKFTSVGDDGTPQFVADKPLVVPIRDLMDPSQADVVARIIDDAFAQYALTLNADRRHLLSTYRLVDVAHKIVGVGSVGLRAWIALFVGRDNSDPLILQMKQAQRSVLAEFVGESEYVNQGERVVNGQRLMQATTDVFLGWQRVTAVDGQQRDFYMRQLRDGKGSADIDSMAAEALATYGFLCGITLARAHARSGDRFAIADYVGKSASLDNALAEFGERYADQNERDYDEMLRAIKSGKITAQSGL